MASQICEHQPIKNEHIVGMIISTADFLLRCDLSQIADVTLLLASTVICDAIADRISHLLSCQPSLHACIVCDAIFAIADRRSHVLKIMEAVAHPLSSCDAMV